MFNRPKRSEESNLPEVIIVSSRCTRTSGLFGIRFEKMGEAWIGTWTFAIEEKKAAKEGYNRNEVRGSFAFDEKFPGCPHCENHSLYLCQCGKVGCFDGEAKTIKCPWCRAQGTIEGKADRLSGGVDR